MKPRLWLVTAAAGLVLADASIVTLALPELLRALDTSVEGVAAVIAVYTIVLAAALLPAERLLRRHDAPLVGAAGFVAFGLASVVCAAAGSLEVLLAARALQALGGAAALVASFALIDGGGPAGRRHWLAAAVLATAVGPALGGALTQAFDWRSIFVVQVPLAAAAALAALREERAERRVEPPAHEPPIGPPEGGRTLSAVALALLSAALTAVLFLLVLLLVAGWAVSPLAAAAAVSVLPLAAFGGSRVGGAPRTRAAAGSALVGAGVLALAWLPDASVAWTLLPQALAGVGMGMALPAFAGELLPERTTREAASLLTIRHAGIALVIVALAPLISTRLEETTQVAKERGVALVLDASLPPEDKLGLAPALLSGVDADRPRAGLDAALEEHRGDYEGEDGEAYDALAARADETLVTAVGEAFRWPFVVAGALALLAAALLVLGGRRAAPTAPAAPMRAEHPPPPRADGLPPTAAHPVAARSRAGAPAGALVLVLLAVPLAYAGLHAAIAPDPVAIVDPCEGRDLPGSGGITGFFQDRALEALDAGACRLRVSREELVLAVADDDAARRFEDAHGIDPRSATDVLGHLIDP